MHSQGKGDSSKGEQENTKIEGSVKDGTVGALST